MSLLDPKTWQSHASRALSGPEYAVTEPATGETLGTVVLATGEDVTTAAQAARTAQAAWARTPHFVRAGVLRRAGDLFAAHADELRDWLVRESGSIPGKADFELHVAAQECYEAAARLPSRRAGAALRGAPAVVHAARARRGRRGDLTVQRPADPLHSLRRPGSRARQRGRPEAGPAYGGLRRALPGRGLRRGGTARGPAAHPAGRPGRGSGAGRRPAGARHLLHRLHRRRPCRRGGGRPPSQARSPGARRQLRHDRPGGRRPRRGDLHRGLGFLLPPGPDLHDDRPPPRPRVDLRGVRRAARRQGRLPRRRRPAPRPGPPRPDHRRRPTRQDPRPGGVQYGEWREACGRRHA